MGMSSSVRGTEENSPWTQRYIYGIRPMWFIKAVLQSVRSVQMNVIICRDRVTPFWIRWGRGEGGRARISPLWELQMSNVNIMTFGHFSYVNTWAPTEFILLSTNKCTIGSSVPQNMLTLWMQLKIKCPALLCIWISIAKKYNNVMFRQVTQHNRIS